jgi:hypothetical protein
MSNNRKSLNNDDKRNILIPESFESIHLYDSRFSKIVQAGHTTTLQPTLSDINDSGNANFLIPDTATTLSIVSASDDDTFPLGSGLTTILINGLDQNLNEINDVVLMNGTTPVISNLSFRTMNISIALSGGTPGSGCVGDITISAVSDGQVFGKYKVNDTTCEVGRYTVKKGYKLLVTSILFNGGKGVDMTLKSEVSIPGRLPISIGETYPSEGIFIWKEPAPIFYHEGEMFKPRGFYNSGGSGTRYFSILISGQLATNATWASIKS